MTDKVLERFTALFDLVNKVHDQCKREHDVMTLLDVFAEHNSLSLAFYEDCQTYLKQDNSPSVQLTNLLNEIHSALCCAANHIQLAAHQLQTPFINHLIRQMAEPREFPN